MWPESLVRRTNTQPMEARKLKTVEDLLLCPDERVELIGGEIVRRPTARSEHGLVQGSTRAELSPFTRPSGPDGWWIITEGTNGRPGAILPRAPIRKRAVSSGRTVGLSPSAAPWRGLR